MSWMRWGEIFGKKKPTKGGAKKEGGERYPKEMADGAAREMVSETLLSLYVRGKFMPNWGSPRANGGLADVKNNIRGGWFLFHSGNSQGGQGKKSPAGGFSPELVGS